MQIYVDRLYTLKGVHKYILFKVLHKLYRCTFIFNVFCAYKIHKYLYTCIYILYKCIYIFYVLVVSILNKYEKIKKEKESQHSSRENVTGMTGGVSVVMSLVMGMTRVGRL